MFEYASYLSWRGPGEHRRLPSLRARFAFAAVILGALFGTLHLTRDEQKVRPGDPAIHTEIEQSTDCVALQLRIDTNTSEATRFAAGDRRRDLADAYVEHAEDRRRELRCD